MQNYYDILGLRSGASVSEVKRAYRSLAKKYHPDINPSAEAKQFFIRITEAYECLTDSDKRFFNERRMRREHRSESNSDPDMMRKRREEARRRAQEFARMNFESFQQTQTFRSTVKHYVPQFAGCFVAGVFTIGLISLVFSFSSIGGTVLCFIALPLIALLFQYWENWRKRW